MLVNMMGIEEGADVDSAVPSMTTRAADPKSRDTLTTLFGALLASFVTSSAPAFVAPPAEPVRAIALGAGAPEASGALAQDAA